MTLQQLRDMPTVIGNVHESCYRSFCLVRYIEHLLEAETPPLIVLELLREIHYGFPSIEVSHATKD